MHTITTLGIAKESTKGDAFNSVQRDPEGVKIIFDGLPRCTWVSPLADGAIVYCQN